jgi:hypothetical protein
LPEDYLISKVAISHELDEFYAQRREQQRQKQIHRRNTEFNLEKDGVFAEEDESSQAGGPLPKVDLGLKRMLENVQDKTQFLQGVKHEGANDTYREYAN